MHYLMRGLYSLQILSFLKVATEITGDAKYTQRDCLLYLVAVIVATIGQHGFGVLSG